MPWSKKMLTVSLVLSVVIILILGISIAQSMGREKGIKEINQLYLSVACSNFAEFQNRLENYNTDHLPIKLTAEQKQDWVNKHLAGCRLSNDLSTVTTDTNISQLLFNTNLMLLKVVKVSGNYQENKSKVDEVINDKCDVDLMEVYLADGYMNKSAEPIRKAMVCTARLATALGFRK